MVAANNVGLYQPASAVSASPPALSPSHLLTRSPLTSENRPTFHRPSPKTGVPGARRKRPDGAPGPAPHLTRRRCGRRRPAIDVAQIAVTQNCTQLVGAAEPEPELEPELEPATDAELWSRIYRQSDIGLTGARQNLRITGVHLLSESSSTFYSSGVFSHCDKKLCAAHAITHSIILKYTLVEDAYGV